MDIKFVVTLRDMLPEVLGDVFEHAGLIGDADQVRAEARDTARRALTLARTVDLPAVPRVGERVWADPNWEPVTVREVEWTLVPDGDDPHVRVRLDDLDEDEVGAEWGATELLLDNGWTVQI
ncbi:MULTISPECIES: hypothetical protein [unclassified Frankia]|uniref:hypothetical protein n=1 Tax=unclassified Frankia TaxID=2632575 RepID=UPI002AD35FDA|nr:MULTISPECIES: hypothetical protein [unclassified Frankia]